MVPESGGISAPLGSTILRWLDLPAMAAMGAQAGPSAKLTGGASGRGGDSGTVGDSSSNNRWAVQAASAQVAKAVQWRRRAVPMQARREWRRGRRGSSSAGGGRWRRGWSGDGGGQHGTVEQPGGAGGASGTNTRGHRRIRLDCSGRVGSADGWRAAPAQRQTVSSSAQQQWRRQRRRKQGSLPVLASGTPPGSQDKAIR